MRRERTSRRRFLARAVLGAAAAAAGGPATAASSGETVGKASRDPDRERLERLARRYGGELGDVREAGR